jgi:GTPase SAR1 family protein
MLVNDEGKLTHLSLLVLGAADAGKSSLIDRFLIPAKPICFDYDPTIMQSHTFQHMIEPNKFQTAQKEKITYDSQKIVLNIVEIGGLHPILLGEAIQEADGYMLVYSIGSKSSFTYAYDLFQKIMKTKFSGAFGTLPIMMVGTKIDLSSESRFRNGSEDHFESQVTFDMGQELSSLMQIKFMETTALAPTSVQLCFRTLIHQCQIYAFQECFPNGKLQPTSNPLEKIKVLLKFGPKKKKNLKKHVSMVDLKNVKSVNTSPILMESVRVWLPEEVIEPAVLGSLRSEIEFAYRMQFQFTPSTLEVLV